jgi:streptogramin lyase
VLSGGTGWHITLGPDGNMWFTELTGNRIGKVQIQAK